MGMLDRCHRRWLGTPSTTPGVVAVAKAVVFGDETGAAKAAKLWAMKAREAEQAEAERARVAASADFVRREVERTGSFFPSDFTGRRGW